MLEELGLPAPIDEADSELVTEEPPIGIELWEKDEEEPPPVSEVEL